MRAFKSLPLYLGLIFAVEISASRYSSIFSSVPDLDLTNVVLVSTSFGRLMLFLDGGTDGLRPFEVLTPVIKVYKPFKVHFLYSFCL
jgi:hypothetical protein